MNDEAVLKYISTDETCCPYSPDGLPLGPTRHALEKILNSMAQERFVTCCCVTTVSNEYTPDCQLCTHEAQLLQDLYHDHGIVLYVALHSYDKIDM